jgi:hypothetical protein
MLLTLLPLLPHLPPNQGSPLDNNIDCYWAILQIDENIPGSVGDIDRFKWLLTIDPFQICSKL